MAEQTGRVAGGLVLLLLVWSGVYWLWQPKAKISIAEGQDAGALRGTAMDPAGGPVGGPAVVPVREAPAVTPQPVAKAEPAPERRPAVVAPRFIRHVIQSGETFETLAERYYGKRELHVAISKANPMVDPTRLKPGREVLVPEDPANIQGKPAEEPGVVPRVVTGAEPTTTPGAGASGVSAEEEYTVEAGDSLAKIAKKKFGNESFADAIFEANKDRLSSPEKIKVGQKLRMPRK